NSGIYVLIFHLSNDVTMTIGKRGELDFQSGWYGYVGSGKSGVEARVRRHLRTHDRPHWHLDFLMHLGNPLPPSSATLRNRWNTLCSATWRQYSWWFHGSATATAAAQGTYSTVRNNRHWKKRRCKV
ncbi:MAG: DUF123 domain-containing protein, partial [Dehalococcoidia bacterium]